MGSRFYCVWFADAVRERTGLSVEGAWPGIEALTHFGIGGSTYFYRWECPYHFPFGIGHLSFVIEEKPLGTTSMTIEKWEMRYGK